MASLAARFFSPTRALGQEILRSQVNSYLHQVSGLRTIHTDTEHLRKVPTLVAPSLLHARKSEHVAAVADQLEKDGILRITLGFQDDDSRYLQSLIQSLHTNHNHRLPISHSATKGWFWDVRPSSTHFQTANHQARSETMEDFPWHTDCSYEYPPPRYFALQVLQPDRFGGGTLSVMSVARLTEYLSATTRAALMRPDFRIAIPTEFVKDPSRTSIRGRLLIQNETTTGGGRGSALIRFREDIVTPLSAEAAAALDDLGTALRHLAAAHDAHSTLHLSAQDLPARSIIVIDNRRWLHARNHVRDPERHLRRVRWDAAPFTADNDTLGDGM